MLALLHDPRFQQANYMIGKLFEGPTCNHVAWALVGKYSNLLAAPTFNFPCSYPPALKAGIKLTPKRLQTRATSLEDYQDLEKLKIAPVAIKVYISSDK
jgi:hypothetical protein